MTHIVKASGICLFEKILLYTALQLTSVAFTSEVPVSNRLVLEMFLDFHNGSAISVAHATAIAINSAKLIASKHS